MTVSHPPCWWSPPAPPHNPEPARPTTARPTAGPGPTDARDPHRAPARTLDPNSRPTTIGTHTMTITPNVSGSGEDNACSASPDWAGSR